MEEGAVGAQAARQIRGKWAVVIATLIAVVLSLFELYTAAFGVFTLMIQQSVFLAFILPLVFLLFPMARGRAGDSGDRVPVWDLFLALLGFAVGAYVVVNYEALALREGAPSPTDIYMGIIAIVLVLEATRRTVGPIIVVIAMLFLLYALLGPLLPIAIAHRGYSIERISYQMYSTTNGIFGTPLGVASTIIYLFVLFGAFSQKSGAGQLFTDFANAAVGWTRGGPAKVSVVSSSLFGTISGSAVANVVVDGWRTIPMMKNIGYRPHVAAAIEAVASTGGQIMPPVMGAAAFIMAEVTNIPYSKIVTAAAIPAILFYAAAFFMVDLEAAKMGIKRIPKSEIPHLYTVLKAYGHAGIPLGVLLYLLVQGYSPGYAALWSLAATLPVSMLRKHTRIGVRQLIGAVDTAAKNMLSVASICACAGIVIGAITLTGLGLKLSSLLVNLAGGNLVVMLLLTMVASLILGMGVPTAASYILLAALVAPALVDIGVPMLAAHLFIFYFGILSAITPPVALAAYAAAPLGGADPNRTGYAACRIAMAAYIVPFMFVYGPALLLVGSLREIVLAFATGVLGTYALAVGLQGYMLTGCSLFERGLLLAAAIMLIKPGWVTDAVGIGLVVSVLLIQMLRSGYLAGVRAGWRGCGEQLLPSSRDTPPSVEVRETSEPTRFSEVAKDAE